MSNSIEVGSAGQHTGGSIVHTRGSSVDTGGTQLDTHSCVCEKKGISSAGRNLHAKVEGKLQLTSIVTCCLVEREEV